LPFGSEDEDAVANERVPYGLMNWLKYTM